MVALTASADTKRQLADAALRSGSSDDWWALCRHILYNEDDEKTFLWAASQGRKCAIAERSATSIATYYDYMAEYSLSVGRVAQYMPYKRKALAIYRAVGARDKETECCIYIGNYFNATDSYDSARIYLERMDAYARTRPAETSYNIMLSCLSDTYYRMGRLDSAESKELQSVHYSRQLADTLTLLGSYRALGMYARAQGRLEEALDYYGQALSILAGNDDLALAEDKAALYVNLSVLCHDMKQPDDALRYADGAMELVGRLHNDLTSVQLYANTGMVYLRNHDFDQASSCLQQGMRLARKMDDANMQLRVLGYLVEMKTLLNEPDSASYYIRMAAPLLGQVRMLPTLVGYLQAEMDALMAQGRYREALTVGKRLENMTEGRKFIRLNLYSNLQQCYKHTDDYVNALRCAELSAALNDSLKGVEQDRALSELNVKYATKEKELELLRLQSRQELAAERHKYHIAGLMLALLAVAFAALLVVGRLRKKADNLKHYAEAKDHELALLQSDTELRLTRKFLDGVEAERNRLARELHDGVSNDLYALELRLRQENTASAAVLSGLSGIRMCVRDISHELMPPSFSQLTLKEIVEHYACHLCEASGIVCSFCAEPEDAGWERVDQRTGMMLYRIAQEVLSNVVRHACATRVTVSMELMEDNVLLCVADDGNADGRERCAGQDGIGLRTMQERAALVGGVLWRESRDGQTYCYFSMPLSAGASRG